MPNKSKPFYAILRKWYVILSLLIVAVALVIYWQANLVPEYLSAPSPVMPSPNARDFYMAGVRLERDKKAVDTALQQSSWRAAGIQYPALPGSTYHIFTVAEEEKLIAENAPALAEARQGMKFSYLSPQATSVTTYLDYEEHDASPIVSLFVVQGNTRAAHGDWSAAMSSYIDAIKLGSDMPRGSGMLVSMVSGCHYEREGQEFAHAAIEHLTGVQAVEDSQRLAAIDENQVPFSQALQGEEWGSQVLWADLFSHRQWRQGFVDSPDTVGFAKSVKQRMQMIVESPREGYNNYTPYMNAWISRAKLPWPVQRILMPLNIPTDPVAAFLVQDIQGDEFHDLDTLALNRLLETQLALRAYKLDRGRYPADLTSLTPKYLPSVPLDPFANNSPLRYRLLGDTYLLYSIGPDALDDGGSPIGNLSRNGHGYYTGADPSEKGDIVAGVNS